MIDRAAYMRGRRKLWRKRGRCIVCGGARVKDRTCCQPCLDGAKDRRQQFRERQLYVYRWNRMGRKGQRCVVLARGSMNSCWVKFEDGFQAITSRNALRKA
jgi:hypothetical protein